MKRAGNDICCEQPFKISWQCKCTYWSDVNMTMDFTSFCLLDLKFTFGMLLLASMEEGRAIEEGGGGACATEIILHQFYGLHNMTSPFQLCSLQASLFTVVYKYFQVGIFFSPTFSWMNACFLAFNINGNTLEIIHAIYLIANFPQLVLVTRQTIPGVPFWTN